jgi:hypothetical protein
LKSVTAGNAPPEVPAAGEVAPGPLAVAPAAPPVEARLGLPAAPLLAAAPDVFATPVPAAPASAEGVFVAPELISELIAGSVPAPLWLATAAGFSVELPGAEAPALAPALAGALAPALAASTTGPL